MTIIYVLLAIVFIMVIGFIKLQFTIQDIVNRILFVREYRDNFLALANSNNGADSYFSTSNFNHEVYNYLVLNSVKAQREMGSFGIGEYVSPFQMYKVRNYEFITGIISKFTEGMLHNQELSIVDNILLRRIGHYQEILQELNREVLNPFKSLQYGVRLIIGLPIYLLNWFGIISDTRLNVITSNSFFKIISGLIGLLSFFSAIVTIFTGWGAFKAILATFFK